MSRFEDAIRRGLRSAQPAATTVVKGTLYFVTDEGVTERSSGTAWEAFTDTGGSGITQLTGNVTAGPGTGSQVATIPNNTVTYAKMQDVSAISKLIGRGAGAGAGDPEEITLGTGLTMTGTTLSSSGGSAGGRVLLATQTAAAQATLDFTTRTASGQSGAIFQSDYDEYLIEIIGLLPATDAVDLYWRFSTDGGSTYDATSKYVSTILAWISSTTATAGEDPAGAVAQFAMRKSGIISNNASYGLDGCIRLAIPGGSKFPRCIGDFGFATNAIVAQAVTHRGIYISSTAINAIRFLFSSGNITSGIVRIYGIAKT